MKKLKLILIHLLVINATVLSQNYIEYIDFTSKQIEEFEWSLDSSKYVLKVKRPLETLFSFNQYNIDFKKGEEIQKTNNIKYIETVFKDSNQYLIYIDSHEQRIEYNTDNSCLDYYYEWNNSISAYMQLARYTDITIHKLDTIDFESKVLNTQDIENNSKYTENEEFDFQILDGILGEYKYKKSKSLDFKKWKIRSEELFFTIEDFDDDVYKNIKIKLYKSKTLFNENQYFLEFYENNKLVHKHYISIIGKRDNNVYDILSGQNLIVLNFENKYALVYYEFNFNNETFKHVFLFYN